MAGSSQRLRLLLVKIEDNKISRGRLRFFFWQTVLRYTHPRRLLLLYVSSQYFCVGGCFSKTKTERLACCATAGAIAPIPLPGAFFRQRRPSTLFGPSPKLTRRSCREHSDGRDSVSDQHPNIKGRAGHRQPHPGRICVSNSIGRTKNRTITSTITSNNY